MGNTPIRRVLLFGSFDPLHAGHEHLFLEAKALGDYLTVVVDRDSTIRQLKKREPHIPEQERRAAVQANPAVDETLLGDEDPLSYGRLKRLPFAVLALGYDQTPSDEEVRTLLARLGRPSAEVIRLKPYKPGKYKSSYLRENDSSITD